MIAKGYIRKNYANPYLEIEDKVGVRFVVLLNSDISNLCELITSCKDWTHVNSRHFENDKEENPLLFDYQSVHYVLRPSSVISAEHSGLHQGITCEVQVRTLLQHAHSELTHDLIYKPSTKVKPHVQRAAAKAMALIETTGDLFGEVSDQIQGEVNKVKSVRQSLDDLYLRLVGKQSHNDRAGEILIDLCGDKWGSESAERIEELFSQKSSLKQIISNAPHVGSFYDQSAVLLAYLLIRRHKEYAKREWPLNRDLLKTLADDLSVSVEDI